MSKNQKNLTKNFYLSQTSCITWNGSLHQISETFSMELVMHWPNEITVCHSDDTCVATYTDSSTSEEDMLLKDNLHVAL